MPGLATQNRAKRVLQDDPEPSCLTSFHSMKVRQFKGPPERLTSYANADHVYGDGHLVNSRLARFLSVSSEDRGEVEQCLLGCYAM
jgi:hypothetical protein